MFMKQLFKQKTVLRNQEQGRQAFILGNGPSIIKEDLSRLAGQVTIGMNASTMLERQFGFTQTYYCLSDSRFLQNPEKRGWATSNLNETTLRVVRKDIRGDDDPSLAIRTFYTPHIKRDGFSPDLDMGFFYGCTTTMLAVQLAFHIGCTDIFLLGVDLRYAPESLRFYKEKNPQLEDSFTSVQIWNLANAGRLMAAQGRHLFNCSERSLLRPYLPYIPFSEVIEDITVQSGQPLLQGSEAS